MTDVREQLSRYCEVLETTQPRVDLACIVSPAEEPSRRKSRTAAALSALTITVVAALVGVAVVRHGATVESPTDPWQIDRTVAAASLEDVSFGVSVLAFGSAPAFVVRDIDSVRVFLTNVQHLPREDTLWWCPRERVFAGPLHAEVFSTHGEALGGPAQRGLEELEVDVASGRVTVRLDRIRVGPRHNPEQRYETGDRAWDSGRGSFCQHPLKNGRHHGGPPLGRADAVQIVSAGGQADIEEGAVFSAKLITRADYQRWLAPSQSRPSSPSPLLWFVEVHGRLHPSYGVAPSRPYEWGLFAVDAATGDFSGVQMLRSQSPFFASLRDRGL